jgi:hypothetical protein
MPSASRESALKAYLGFAATTFMTTQWLLPMRRIRSNPCFSNVDRLPLYRKDEETKRPDGSSG